MDIGESVNVALEKLLANDKACSGQEEKPANFAARINKWGTKTDCSGTRLYNQMLRDRDIKQGYLGPPKAFVSKPSIGGYKWYFDKLSPSSFPVQAHHLIPKNYLPDHPVCAFLAKKDTRNKKFQLVSDTDYDTDHPNNGYCMPYATPLADWKSAGGDDSLKLTICFEVMEITGRQLHQGSHRAAAYDGPVDDDEEAKIHPDGYLNTVKKYLGLILGAAMKHVSVCSVCKPSKEKKEINPRMETVRHMDMVSGIIKLLVDANRIFVSEPAHIWWHDKRLHSKLPKWLKGK